jgi:hypothetical protein
VRDILRRRGRAATTSRLVSIHRIGTTRCTTICTYALAYGIATLMTNLFGRGKEPFWQQPSTNLVKFVILRHQTLDDYVTLFQVYEHVINADKLRARIAEGERRFTANNRRIVVDKREHLYTAVLSGWTWQDDESICCGRIGFTAGLIGHDRHFSGAAHHRHSRISVAPPPR